MNRAPTATQRRTAPPRSTASRLTWKFSRSKGGERVATAPPRVWLRGSGARCAREWARANRASLEKEQWPRAVARSVLGERRARIAHLIRRAFDATRATSGRNARNSISDSARFAFARRSLHRRKAPSKAGRDARNREANRSKRADTQKKTGRFHWPHLDSNSSSRAQSLACLEGTRAMKLHPTRATLC